MKTTYDNLTVDDYWRVFNACKKHKYTPIQAIDKLLDLKGIYHKNLDVKVLHVQRLKNVDEVRYQFFFVNEDNQEVNIVADKRGFKGTTNFYLMG